METRAPENLPDAADRQRAATLFDRNLVVVAGAGTGKTSLLVERALNLIGGAGVEIGSLAIITFTEKAAATLRQRLALGLDGLRDLAARDAPPGDLDPRVDAHRAYAWLRTGARQAPGQIKERALAALLALDAASVSTIHAFCAEILRRHPRRAGVDPSFLVDEGAASGRIFAAQRERFLAEELGPRGARADLWRRALRLPDALGAVGDLGLGLSSFAFPGEALRNGENPAPGGAQGPAAPAALLVEEARAARDGVAAILERASGLPPMMGRYLLSARAFLTAFLEGGPDAMEAAGAPLPLDEFAARALPETGKGLTGAAPEEVRAAARRAHDLVAALRAVDEETIRTLVRASAPLAGRCRERLLESGQLSFDALLRLARDLLASDAGIRRSLAARYRALLVDEFQDTDPLQYEILFFLAEAEGPAAADAYRADLAPGRLFIVGDPKQSIYRFRGADIEAYRRAIDRVLECGGERLTLTASFRSPAEIVEPINRLFEGWIGPRQPEDAAFEPVYDRIVSARGSSRSAEARVEIWSIATEGKVRDRRQGEAAAIARFILDNTGRPEATGAPLLFREVAILLRALTNAGLYAQALRAAGIPFIVEGGRDFYERPEVGDLIAFLSAVANPNDGASILAVLRSPLGAAPDDELARFAQGGGSLDLPGGGLADLGPYPNVGRTFRLLESFRSRTRGSSPDDILRAALTSTPLALLHASAHEGAQRLANLRKLVARSETLARQGLSLEETLRSIEEEFKDARSEGESPLADETIDAVRILSVHKAKGLEFPVVVVPDLGRESRTRAPEGTEAAWTGGGGAGALAVRLGDGTCNLAWVRHQGLKRRHEAAEEKRVFYVACTRAAERLILVNSSPDRKAPWRDALAALGYTVARGFPAGGLLAGGGVLHRLLTPPAPAVAPPSADLEPIWAEAAARFETIARDAAATAIAPVRWPSGARDATLAGAGETGEEPRGARPGAPGAASRDIARAAGTAVHAALERWDFRDGARLRALGESAADRLAEEIESGVPGAGRGARPVADLAAQISAEVRRILEAFLASPLAARLAGLEVLGREVPVLYRDETEITWIGACDLVYRDGDGTVVVADYKTDAAIQGDPAASAERYRPQMTVYLEAMRRVLPGRPVRGEILLLRTGDVIPI